MAGYIKGISQPSYLGSSGSSLSPKDDKKSARFGKREEKYEYRSNHINYGGTYIQNVKAARVYMFGDSNFAEDDDETVEFEMRSRHKKASSFIGENNIEEQKQYFEKEIVEGETLQAIALKYACQISEIKRINNLIQDQEFYALKVIKVPMTKYGILSEQFGTQDQVLKHPRSVKNQLGNSFHSEDQDLLDQFNESDSQHDFSDPETQIKVLRTLSIRDNFTSEDREAEKFLNKMDEDLKKLKQSTRGERESLTEVISVLTNKSIHPLETSKPISKGNGADCGISWWSILIASLAIAVIAPLVILIYYYFINHDGSN